MEIKPAQIVEPFFLEIWNEFPFNPLLLNCINEGKIQSSDLKGLGGGFVDVFLVLFSFFRFPFVPTIVCFWFGESCLVYLCIFIIWFNLQSFELELLGAVIGDCTRPPKANQPFIVVRVGCDRVWDFFYLVGCMRRTGYISYSLGITAASWALGPSRLCCPIERMPSLFLTLFLLGESFAIWWASPCGVSDSRGIFFCGLLFE